MKIFLWHVHGSYTTALVEGSHEYAMPVLPGRGADGRGRADTWDPRKVIEVAPADAGDAAFDLVVLQRPRELELCERWLGRRPGLDIPAVYLEHNPPPGPVSEARHPIADRPEMTLVQVTYFNDVLWDAGTTPTRVIEHGIIDPGYRYTGELERCAVAINEPIRRGRVTGVDLLPRLARVAPLDLFGIGAGALGGVEAPPQPLLHAEMASRRLYLHPFRWTSLGLTLIEAMHLGIPVVALATTEVPEAVPPAAGTVSTSVERLCGAIRRLMANPGEARERGQHARRAALERYSLERFLADWDAVFNDLAQ